MSRLRAFALAAGEQITSAANQPVILGDAASCWFVESGVLDCFVHQEGDTLPTGRRHLLRAETGQLVFGWDEALTDLRLTAKGAGAATLYRMPTADLERPDLAPAVAGAVDRWVAALAEATAGLVDYRPSPDQLVQLRDGLTRLRVRSGDVLAARSDTVAWLRADDGDAPALSYLGTEQARTATWVALTSESWVSLNADMVLELCSSLDLARGGHLASALEAFHELVLAAERLNRLLTTADEVNEQALRAASRRRARERSLRMLAALAHRGTAGERHADAASEWESVLATVGHCEGFQLAPLTEHEPAAARPLDDLLASSSVGVRSVRFEPGERWWRTDNGALVATVASDGRPVALLPRHWGGYRVVEASGRQQRLGARLARALDIDAWQLYAPLPDERPVGPADLFRLGRRRLGADGSRFAVAGLLTGLLAQTPAIALGVLTAGVLSFSSRSALRDVVAAVLLMASLALGTGILSGAALMRIEGRSAARLDAAAWLRLLRLPPRFFRNSVAGELATRMATFRTMRDALAGAVAHSGLALVFAAPAFGVLMLYDLRLGVLSIAAAVASFGVLAALSARQMGPQRQLHDTARRLGGQMLQIVHGSSKIRATGTQGPAFALWAERFGDVERAQIRVSRIGEHMVAFGAALPAAAAALLVGATVAGFDSGAGVSEFLVVYTASATFFGTLAVFGGALQTLVAAIPAYEQVQPILQAVPEPREAGAGPVRLRGEVRLDRVSFRYAPGDPLVLDDVSIHVRPGEFVAIVGGSGAGKSTVLRLLLGLDEPASGTVSFDGRDLRHVDRSAVRRQIGTVPQDAVLQPGTLLDNIIGAMPGRSVDEAWEAARLAAVDRDIAAMPMSMQTFVSDRVTTFSGGQVQRVRIAAALASKPRVLVFDEATSWLDAATQSQVMANIEELAVTRIVVAHRLSTIRSADHIYVLEAGRVVQQGSYADLIDKAGPFAELVRRQQV